MTTYAALQSRLNNPLLEYLGQCEADHAALAGVEPSFTPEQSAALLNLGIRYAQWRTQVLDIADSTDDSEGIASTLRNLVDDASRQFNKFIGGDFSMGNVLQQTMSNTMDLAAQARSSNFPALRDVYDATTSSLQTLIVTTARTAGSAAGALLKSAADELQVEPAEVGSGIKYVAAAVGLAATAYILFQLRIIFRRR